MIKKLSLQFIFLILSFPLITTVAATPVTIIGEVPERTVSINKIEHSVFDKLLKKYVDERKSVV